MITLVICNSDKGELSEMEQYSHYLAAHLSDEEWKFHMLTSGGELEKFVEQEPTYDIVCIDLAIEGGIELATKLRKMNNHAYIILVANLQISPMQYIRPDIMAGSLLIRVYTKEQLKEVFYQAFHQYISEFSSDDEKEDMYVIESREGRRLIPYSQIYYFEARNKKIIVGCASEEIACYDTIANLEEGMPDYFVRCHRSFIINLKKVVKAVLSQNEIEMENDIFIPISRSYKSNLRSIYSAQKKSEWEEM